MARSRGVVAGIGLLALMVSGCGEGGQDGTTDPPPSTSPSPSATADPAGSAVPLAGDSLVHITWVMGPGARPSLAATEVARRAFVMQWISSTSPAWKSGDEYRAAGTAVAVSPAVIEPYSNLPAKDRPGPRDLTGTLRVLVGPTRVSKDQKAQLLVCSDLTRVKGIPYADLSSPDLTGVSVVDDSGTWRATKVDGNVSLMGTPGAREFYKRCQSFVTDQKS